MSGNAIFDAARRHMGDRLLGQLRRALAVAGGTHAVEDVLAAVRSGDMQWFQGERSVVVTEIRQYPRARALHVFLAAGDLAEIFGPLHDRVEAFGRAAGCDRMTVVGRRGWARAGARIGFEHRWCGLAKAIRA